MFVLRSESYNERIGVIRSPFHHIYKHDQWRMQKIFMGGFQSAKIFLCTKIESMIRKNIKQAAIQYLNVVKLL